MSKKNTLTARDFFIFLLGIVMYFIFVRTLNKTLNYPINLYYAASLVIAILAFIMGFRNLKVSLEDFKSTFEKVIVIVIDVFKSLFIGLFVVGVILIPLNYYNISYSKSNPASTYSCKIEPILSPSHYKTIYFYFRNKLNHVDGYQSIMDEMYTNHNPEKYVLIITAKQGLAGTFIIEHWDVKKN